MNSNKSRVEYRSSKSNMSQREAKMKKQSSINQSILTPISSIILFHILSMITMHPKSISCISYPSLVSDNLLGRKLSVANYSELLERDRHENALDNGNEGLRVVFNQSDLAAQGANVCRQIIGDQIKLLLKHHLDTLSMVASDHNNKRQLFLSESARDYVSQIFTDNLRSFTEKNCPPSGVVVASEESYPDSKALNSINKTLKLAYETFHSNYHVEAVADDPAEPIGVGNGINTARRWDKIFAQLNGNNNNNNNNRGNVDNYNHRNHIKSTPTSTSSFQSAIMQQSESNRNGADAGVDADDDNNISSSIINLIKKINFDLKNPYLIRETNDRNAARKANSIKPNIVYQIRVLHDLKPRSLMDKLNGTMQISYSEYLDDNAKRLLVFQNDSKILIMICATRYNMDGITPMVVTLVIFIVIVIGNGYILVSTRSCRRRRSNVNFYIVHLAIADLLVGVFSMGTDALIRYLRVFTLGTTACVVYKYLSAGFVISSTYLVVSLGYDRHEAVVYPLNFARNRHRGNYLVCGAYILSAILSLPILFLSKVVEVDGKPQCNIVMPPRVINVGWKIYVLYMLTITIIIPLILLSYFYSQIVFTINKKWRQTENLERDLNREIEYHSAARPQSHDQEEGGQEEQQQQQHEMTKTTSKPNDCIKTQNIDLESSPGGDKQSNLDDIESSSDDDGNTTQCNFIKALKYSRNNPVDVEISASAGGDWAKHRNTVRKKSTSGRAEARPKNTCPSQLEQHSTTAKPGRNNNNNLVNRQHGKSVIPKARMKTINMTIAIVIVFIACWLPFYLVNMISVFDLLPHRPAYWDDLMSFTNIFCFLNSAMNPILYFVFSRDHKKTKQDSKTVTNLDANSSIRSVTNAPSSRQDVDQVEQSKTIRSKKSNQLGVDLHF